MSDRSGTPSPKATHLGWTQARVTPAMRATLLGQRGLVVWLTGLSGSGKSTLAVGLDKALHEAGMHSFILDGDNLRQGLSQDLGFTMDQRSENIRRTAEVAKLMAQAGIITICSLISPLAEDRNAVRATCQRDGITLLEVYVNSPLEVCEARDPKGLYAKARRGLIPGFTGIDSPYETPQSPDLELDTSGMRAELCLQRLLQEVVALARWDASHE
jgi:adenylyl-sulfate kinase